MKFSELVDTTREVAATSSRLAKVGALAELLTRAQPDEIPAITGLLLAAPRQGRLGVGWRGIAALDVSHVAESTLTIDEVDQALENLARASGAGSAALRTRLLTDIASRATAAEWDFLTRAMLGELRTGALGGVLLEAIAR